MGIRILETIDGDFTLRLNDISIQESTNLYGSAQSIFAIVF